MPKKETEIRMTQTTFLVLVGILVAAVLLWPKGGVAPMAVAPPTGGANVTPQVPVNAPLIEKTKVYLSLYDFADFADDGQKNLVVGTAKLIKSGNLLETVTTSASTGVASTAEFNGGDTFSVLADATSYYADSKEDIKVTETLLPVEVAIKASGAPTVTVEDKNGNTVTHITLGMNDVSEVYNMIVKRPGDDTWFQFCGVAANYDDEQVEYQVKDLTGSFNKGTLDLVDKVDRLDTAGYEAYWDYNKPIKYYDEETVQFFVKAKKDVDPASGGAFNTTLDVVDCEKNLQNGKIVYTPETAANGDVGLADILYNIEIR
jgi:hypothetical protein